MPSAAPVAAAASSSEDEAGLSPPPSPPEDNLAWFGVFRPYELPLPNQVLPYLLLNPEAQKMADELKRDQVLGTSNSLLVKEGYVLREGFKNIFTWAMWNSISAYLKDFGYQQSLLVQYQAVSQDDGTPGTNQPQPVNVFGTPLPMATVVGPAAALKASGAFVAPWLGCRCSWPCTQLCWFYLLGSQFLQWVAVVVAVLTIVFQVLLLESMIVANFLAEVPHTTTWYEWWTLDEPWLPRLIWLLGKVIVFWFMIGNAVNFDDSQSFLASPEIRLLLRSLANRFEGQTYAYCTVVLWTIISEFATVIVVSYFALVSAIIINVESTGNALGDATIIFLIFDFIPELDGWAMGLIAFAACLPQDFVDQSSTYLQGPRCQVVYRTYRYVLFWWTGIWTTLLILLFRYQMTPLYLWVVPASFLYFLVLWQTWPYCLDGWPVCFPHGGPCIFWAALGTTLLWTGFFILRYGCFLFPCVCAPEVPGWFFFPPSNMLLSPLEGEWDTKYFYLFVERLFGLGGRAFLDGLWGEVDCGWEPLESDYERFYHGDLQTPQQFQKGWETRVAQLEGQVQVLTNVLASLGLGADGLADGGSDGGAAGRMEASLRDAGGRRLLLGGGASLLNGTLI